MEKDWEDSAKHPLPNVPCPSEPKRKESHLVGNEERSPFAHQCCQRSSFLAKSGDSDFVKRLATNLATFSGVFGFSADLETNVKARIMSSSLFSKALPGSQAPSSLPQRS